MFKRSLAIVLTFSVPALALAQRGGGGTGGGSHMPSDKANYGGGSMIKVSNKDIENISPLKLIIDKRKDLKLTDDQVAKLKDREEKMKESMKPSFSALDSLRRVATPQTSTADEGDKARLMDTRRQFAQVVAGIRVQYDGAYNDVIPILDEAQQKTANDLVQKQRSEADDMLHDKLGGGPGSDH